MADKLRSFAQRIRDKVHLPQINAQSREKVDQLITKYVPAAKVTEIAESFKKEAVASKVREIIARYEKFTGVEEIMAIQNTVIDAQERFISAQDKRRGYGHQLADIEARLKELHAEMQNTMKGDEKYLQLCTEEHKLIIQERSLRTLFADAEREERELFAAMSAAVKLGHERERAHAERNKYWYIVASIFGTVLGIAGSSINNRLKMAEFRDMMEEQMARNAGIMYSIAGGATANKTDIATAMKAEFAYQEQLAQNLKLMQENINHLVSKQTSLIEHMNHQEHFLHNQVRELKRLVIAASKSNAESDAELTKALLSVHQDLDDDKLYKENNKEIILPSPPTTSKVALEPNQILTGLGIIVCFALVFGNILGRIS